MAWRTSTFLQLKTTCHYQLLKYTGIFSSYCYWDPFTLSCKHSYYSESFFENQTIVYQNISGGITQIGAAKITGQKWTFPIHSSIQSRVPVLSFTFCSTPVDQEHLVSMLSIQHVLGSIPFSTYTSIRVHGHLHGLNYCTILSDKFLVNVTKSLTLFTIKTKKEVNQMILSLSAFQDAKQ